MTLDRIREIETEISLLEAKKHYLSPLEKTKLMNLKREWSLVYNKIKKD